MSICMLASALLPACSKAYINHNHENKIRHCAKNSAILVFKRLACIVAKEVARG